VDGLSAVFDLIVAIAGATVSFEQASEIRAAVVIAELCKAFGVLWGRRISFTDLPQRQSNTQHFDQDTRDRKS
jgi:hypothetical protein